MARSPGSSNVLLPIAIVAVVVVAILVGVFAMGDEAPPDGPTIISEDVNAKPAGAGTAPEPPAGMAEQGANVQLDKVEPAAEGQETIPAAEAQSGQTPEQDNSGDAQPGQESDANRSESGSSADTASQGGGGSDYLLDESSDAPADANIDRAENPEAGNLPAGRDAQTDLTPSDCQEIVRDTDDGGAAVIPTPSGPNGNTGDCVQSAQ
ncbi:hypothetical protein PARU111607_16455 [Palleronia rufa]